MISRIIQAQANQRERNCVSKLSPKKHLGRQAPAFSSILSSPSAPPSSSYLHGIESHPNMGILETITVPLGEQVSQRGLGVVVAAGFGAFLVLSVVLNVLSQLLLQNPNEPPVVFHWFPIIGSTITYGMAPYRFFSENQAKVNLPWLQSWDSC